MQIASPLPAIDLASIAIMVEQILSKRAVKIDHPVPWMRSTSTAAAIAQAKARARRDLRLACVSDLFGEPVWDMMLALYIARSEKRQESIRSLTIAAGVPPTTALRCLATMEERGIVLRHDDPADGRRVFIVISDDAFAEMDAHLSD